MKNQLPHDNPDQRGKAGRVGPGRPDRPTPAKGVERADAPRVEPSHLKGKTAREQRKP